MHQNQDIIRADRHGQESIEQHFGMLEFTLIPDVQTLHLNLCNFASLKSEMLGSYAKSLSLQLECTNAQSPEIHCFILDGPKAGALQ